MKDYTRFCFKVKDLIFIKMSTPHTKFINQCFAWVMLLIGLSIALLFFGWAAGIFIKDYASYKAIGEPSIQGVSLNRVLVHQQKSRQQT